MITRYNSKRVETMLCNNSHLQKELDFMKLDALKLDREQYSKVARLFWEGTATSFNRCLEIIETEPKDELKESLVHIYHLLMG